MIVWVHVTSGVPEVTLPVGAVVLRVTGSRVALKALSSMRTMTNELPDVSRYAL